MRGELILESYCTDVSKLDVITFIINIRSAILESHKQKIKHCETVQQLKVSKQTVSYKIKRFTELGHGGDRPERERKRTVNTSRN